MHKVKIMGIGSYVPDEILTNEYFEKIVDTSDEWIMTRTGIKERRKAAKEDAASDLSVRAIKNALENANMDKNELDLILVATSTFDYIFPSTACVIQKKLGIEETPGYDMLAACSGFVYGFITATSFISSGMFKNVCVVGVDLLTRIVNLKDRNTCVLFGDGASAVIVSRTPENEDSGVLSTFMGCDGSISDLLKVEGTGSAYPGINDDRGNIDAVIQMAGKEVFKSALKYMALGVNNVLKDTSMTHEDIKLLICHQANKRIISSVGKRLKLPKEKVYVNLERFGNTSAATIPLALDTALQEGRYDRGDILALTAIGGGVTYGAILLRY